jgi:hypothetical protein
MEDRDMSGLKDAMLGDTPFDGSTYDHDRDHMRLAGQLGRVFDCMKDGRWRTLAVISLIAGGTEASVSARLRDIRKPRYGGHTVDRRHVARGLFEYRVVVKDGGC